MKLKDTIYETFVNGEPSRLVTGHKTFDKFLERYINRMSKKGYTVTEKDIKGSGFIIFTNYKTQKCQFFAWRNWLGICDKDGNRIYDGDYLENEEGESVMFCNYKDRDNYVISVAKKYDYQPDIEFDDIDICKKMGISVKFKVFDGFCHF